MRVEGYATFRIESKRAYFRGLKIYANCPTCGHECEWDGHFDYISFPTFGRKNVITLFCKECVLFWDKEIKLRVSIEPYDGKDDNDEI